MKRAFHRLSRKPLAKTLLQLAEGGKMEKRVPQGLLGILPLTMFGRSFVDRMHEIPTCSEFRLRPRTSAVSTFEKRQ